jgi:hypothetical protein
VELIIQKEKLTTSVSSSGMNSVSVTLISNMNHLPPDGILLEITEQQETACDVTHSCAQLSHVCLNAKYKMEAELVQSSKCHSQ